MEILNDVRLIKPRKNQSVLVQVKDIFHQAFLTLDDRSNFMWKFEDNGLTFSIEEFPNWKEIC